MKAIDKLIDQSIVGRWIDVEPIHCHQRDEKNKLVSGVKALSEDGTLTEVKFKFIPEDLHFFFDHKIDHLPGMLEVNGMRQLSLAVAHLIYNVPMNYVALLGWLKVRFYSYGDLNCETRATVKLKDYKFTRFKREYVFSGVMHQGDKKLLRVDGQLIMMHPELSEKVRDMKIAIDDPDVPAHGFEW